MEEVLTSLKKSSIILYNFFNKGNARSVRIKKHIAGSILWRGLAMLIGFIQVPITLNYLQPTAYGIWATIGSVIVLFSFFDIGLSHGLRNKLAEAIANDNHALGKIYVSLTYVLVISIVLIIYTIFLLLFPYINWRFIFNAPESFDNIINPLVFIVFTSFSIGFVLQIVRTIPIADQRPAYFDFIKFTASLFTLIGIIILSLISDGSLIYVGLVFGIVPIVVYLFFTFYFFNNNYKRYKPSFSFVNFNYTKDLTSLGIKFFIIQISALVLYSSDNIIIAQVLSPTEVTPYTISFKYFSAIMMLFTIVTTPYWSSFTDAYQKKDFNWIKSSIKNLRKMAAVLSVIVIIMVILADYVYKLWIGSIVNIPFSLSLFMGVNAILMMFTIPYVNFVNGVGVITLQLIVGVCEAVINIPLSIFLAKYMNYGSTGVIMATCIANFIAFIIWPIQYKKIITNKAKGIWLK